MLLLLALAAAARALAPTSSLGYSLAYDGDAKSLPPHARDVLVAAETEPANEGQTACGLYFEQLRPLFRERPPAVFACALGGLPVFSSDDALELTSGWPAFSKPIAPDHVVYEPDGDATAVKCARSGGHLGHRIRDSHYCVNAGALRVLRPGDALPAGAAPAAPPSAPLPPALAAVLGGAPAAAEAPPRAAVAEMETMADLEAALAAAAPGALTVVAAVGPRCPKCKRAKPKFEAFAAENPEIRCLAADLSRVAGAYTYLQAASVPSFYVFADGERVDDLADVDALAEAWAGDECGEDECVIEESWG